MIELLSQAWKYRQGLDLGATNAYRVFGGEKEGIAGLLIDRYDSVLLITLQEGICRLKHTELSALAKWFVDEIGVKTVYLKHNVADRSHSISPGASGTLLAGEPAPEQVIIQERGLKFLIRPNDGFSTGLFLDQRENRRFLAQGASGKKVLNTFAYTCGFSVACAKSGAQVTSVDLSKKYLEWGKANFAVNDLALDLHAFFARDVFRFFKSAVKREESFDLVIVDPPSFSRDGEGGVFSLKRDLPGLISAATELVAERGRLFFSCNYAGWDSGHVRQIAAQVLGGDWAFETLPPAPRDFEREANPISQLLVVRK